MAYTYPSTFMTFLGKCLPPHPEAGVAHVTSGFGPRNVSGPDKKAGGFHRAVDSAYTKLHPAPPGVFPVYCPFPGTVIRAGQNQYNGVYINDNHGFQHGFLHGSNIQVKAGSSINGGGVVFYMDKKGASAVHFHYQILDLSTGKMIDPVGFWDGKKQLYAPDDSTSYNIAASETDWHNQKTEPSGGSTVADLMPRHAAVSGESATGPALWTNRVPTREPWARTLMVDTPKINTKTDEYEKNTSHNPQFTDDDEVGKKQIGRIDGDEEYQRGPFWRR